jgi:sporulation protein YlmC with PRC-barrel domain
MHRTMMDPTGRKVGTVTDVHLDRTTKQPVWLAVSIGMFGTRISFVPVAAARLDGENVLIAYNKNTITDAPRIEPASAPSIDDEQTLFDHYRTAHTPTSTSGPDDDQPAAAANGNISQAASGPAADADPTEGTTDRRSGPAEQLPRTPRANSKMPPDPSTRRSTPQ